MERAINIAVTCVMSNGALDIGTKQKVIESLIKLEENRFDERLITKIEEWKEQTGSQIECHNEGTDHDLCPNCNEQLYFCDCADRMAQKILELQFGFDDFEDEY